MDSPKQPDQQATASGTETDRPRTLEEIAADMLEEVSDVRAGYTPYISTADVEYWAIEIRRIARVEQLLQRLDR